MLTTTILALLLQVACNEAALEAEIKRGSGLYREGKLDQALATFEAAKGLCTPPRLEVVYNLGLTYWKLGRIVEARYAFEQCRSDPELKPMAERKLADIDKESYLVVRCEHPAAAVSVDGAFVGRTPLKAIRVQPGPHRLEVRREGKPPNEINITSAGGQISYVDCQQGKPVGGGPQAGARGDSPAQGRGKDAGRGRPEIPPPKTPGRIGYRRRRHPGNRRGIGCRSARRSLQGEVAPGVSAIVDPSLCWS